MSAIAAFHFNAKGRHFIFGHSFISEPSFFMLFFKEWIYLKYAIAGIWRLVESRYALFAPSAKAAKSAE